MLLLLLLDQLKKYGDSRTSLRSKLPLSGSGGNVNVGCDVWKLSSNWESETENYKRVNRLDKQNLQTNWKFGYIIPIFKTKKEFGLDFKEEWPQVIFFYGHFQAFPSWIKISYLK